MNIIKLHAIDSTNSFLKELARKEPLPDFTVVTTQNQTAGRGQRGNGWYSTAEGSLIFSVYKIFDHLPVIQHFKISMMVSLALIEAFQLFDIPEIKVKWPNDIMAGNKKIVGILVENNLMGEFITSSVIGIGINVSVKSFPDLPQAGSLSFSSDSVINKEELFQSILKSLGTHLANLRNVRFEELKTLYEAHLFRKNVISVFEDPLSGKRFNAVIKGISSQGELVIETEEGLMSQVGVKELRLLF